MNAVSMVQKSACLLAICFLAGCTPPVQVKDVLANQTSFLDANFSPDNLPPSVRNTITQSDNRPLSFNKMVFHLDWTLNIDDKAKTMHEDQMLTLTNAGGSFARMLIEDSRNSVPTHQQDSLTYRGLLPLRQQSFAMNASIGGFAYVMHDLKQFDPITPTANTLEYAYTSGTSVQFMNFRDGHTTCTLGKPYSASQLFASLEGQARKVDCTWYNSNGAVSGKRTYAYLEHYGVAIGTGSQLASGISEAKVTSASIE
ncbi:MAG: hypothetical protein EPN40_08145 [Rhodanobacteraceae bacterium]|nr:MAG: hypothetical protein EPN40_08145 [Rhodanobacteraceae bacterium]